MLRNITSDYTFIYEIDREIDGLYVTGTANVDYDITPADPSVGEPGGPDDFRISEMTVCISTDTEEGDEITIKPGDHLFSLIYNDIIDAASYAAIDDYNDNR